MRDPLLTNDGTTREITRIEFEPMPGGRFRWTLWSGDVMNHREIGGPETLKPILDTTALFCGEVNYEKVQEDLDEEDHAQIAKVIAACERRH